MISNVFNMDCLKYMHTVPDGFFELAIVDPPYRDENQPTKDMRANGSMKSLEGRPTEEYWKQLFRISKNQIIWGANNFQLPQWKGFVVWEKTTISERFTMSMCEIASLSSGLSTISKLIKMKPQDVNRFHPTQKPIALYKYLIKNYAVLGDKIIDTHMGSQSSRIASYDMGFDYYGCELDTEYYDKGNKRFELFKQQGKLFL